MARYTAENTIMLGRLVRVYLDGVELKTVCEADDELRFVVCYEEEESGRVRLSKPKLRTGTVRVVFTGEVL